VYIGVAGVYIGVAGVYIGVAGVYIGVAGVYIGVAGVYVYQNDFLIIFGIKRQLFSFFSLLFVTKNH